MRSGLLVLSLVLFVADTVLALAPVQPSIPSEPQIVDAYTSTTITPAGSFAASLGRKQRTFYVDEDMRFGGVYLDANPLCITQKTERAFVLVFTPSGKLVLYSGALTNHMDLALPPTYREIFLALTPVGLTFAPGTYTYMYLVTDCTGAFVIVTPYFQSFTILSR